MNPKKEFIEIFKANIHREGADELLEYLQSKNSDFFTAPASTKFHGDYDRGLVTHSVNVYYCLKDYLSRKRCKNEYGMDYSEETVAIVSLLHDVCKINCYHKYMRNVKNEDGVWEQVAAFNFEDPEPFGHGEKSVFLISKFLRLTNRKRMQFVFIWDFPKREAVEMPERHLKSIRLHWHLMLPIWKHPTIWTIKLNLKLKQSKKRRRRKSVA